MARVNNWQIGRTMSYWYAENRPKRQFGAVFSQRGHHVPHLRADAVGGALHLGGEPGSEG